jgi:hypothetical protein
VKRRCSAVEEFIEFYQNDTSTTTKKEKPDSRLRNSPNLREIVKLIRFRAENS